MSRGAGARTLEWGLVGATALWFVGLPLAAAVTLALAPLSLYATATALTAGLQMGGLLVALALGKLIPGRNKLFLVSLALLLPTGWLVVNTGLAGCPTWIALSIGILYLLGPGGWLAGRSTGRTLRQMWAEMGLTRSGSLGWGLAAAALVLWPWFLVGSLGDVRQSAAIALQALAEGLLTEGLWRGLALGLLLSATRKRWPAALLGLCLYLGYELSAALPASLEPAVALLPLALLVTELWARPGKGQHGVWGALVFHTLYLAFPRLFVDPRSNYELAHWATRIYMPLATGGLATLLFLGRTFTGQRRPGRSKLRSAAIAALPWTAALGLYLIFGAPGFANNGYLIIFKEQADLTQVTGGDAIYKLLVETAENSQGEIRAELERMGLPYRPYYLVNMIRVENTTQGMDVFGRRPQVAQVLRNPNVRQYPIRWGLPEHAAETPGALPWGVDSVGADKVWELGITGQGIVVAGQDTGYHWDHPALKDSYRGWDGQQVEHNTNWHDAWDHTPAAFDDGSHGTHTMGTAVGNGVGMAPDAQWIGCRNMRYGLGNPGSYIECMEFFLAPYPLGGDPFNDGDPSLAPHVINNSWGCPAEEGCTGPEPLRTALEALRAAGIMMVVSAGNDGPSCNTIMLGPPADEDAVFSVGASNQEGEVVFFSSRGPAGGGLVKPDVVAPGVHITSSIPGGQYAESAGTSMAGPHVTGLVALLWSARPELVGDIYQTEQIITQTAQPRPLAALCPTKGQDCACGQDRPGQVPNNVYGYGIVDALAAVELGMDE